MLPKVNLLLRCFVLNTGCAATGLLLFIFSTHLSAARLEIAVPAQVSPPVLLYLETENRKKNKRSIQPRTHATISSTGLTFDPYLQVVPVGTTLSVVNKDQMLHNTHVFDLDHTLFNLATPNSGTTVQRRFNRAGLFGVRCDLHPSMRAWIAVVNTPYFAIAQESGIFKIENIKPGRYKVHVLRPDRHEQIIELQLKEKEHRKIRLWR